MEGQIISEPFLGDSFTDCAGDKEQALISMADVPSVVKLSECDGMIKMLQLVGILVMGTGLVLFGLTLQGTILGLGLFVFSVAMLLIAEGCQDPVRTPMSLYRPPTFRISPCKRCLRAGFWVGTLAAFFLSLGLILTVVVNLKHASTYDAKPEKLYVGNDSSPQDTSCYLPTVRHFHFISTSCFVDKPQNDCAHPSVLTRDLVLLLLFIVRIF